VRSGGARFNGVFGGGMWYRSPVAGLAGDGGAGGGAAVGADSAAARRGGGCSGHVQRGWRADLARGGLLAVCGCTAGDGRSGAV